VDARLESVRTACDLGDAVAHLAAGMAAVLAVGDLSVARSSQRLDALADSLEASWSPGIH
jgi:hypothetical protein